MSFGNRQCGVLGESGSRHSPGRDDLEPIIAIAVCESFADDTLLQVIELLACFSLLLNSSGEPAIEFGIGGLDALRGAPQIGYFAKVADNQDQSAHKRSDTHQGHSERN